MAQKSQFLKLLISHEVDLRAFIGAMVRDRDQREDVYQEVAVTLWEGFDRYDADRPFGAWARGIARNKIMQMWDTDRRSALAFAPDAMNAIADAYESAAPAAAEESLQAEALRACMDQLPDHSRRLLDLRYRSDHKLASIAEEVGQTASGVHRSLVRIRATLAECIDRRVKAIERGDEQ